MTNLQRRLRKLETRSSPRGPVRLVVRYETGDPQDTDETESDVDENAPNTLVVVVQYVDMPAKATSGAGAGAAGLAPRIASDNDKYRCPRAGTLARWSGVNSRPVQPHRSE